MYRCLFLSVYEKEWHLLLKMIIHFSEIYFELSKHIMINKFIRKYRLRKVFMDNKFPSELSDDILNKIESCHGRFLIVFWKKFTLISSH